MTQSVLFLKFSNLCNLIHFSNIMSVVVAQSYHNYVIFGVIYKFDSIDYNFTYNELK